MSVSYSLTIEPKVGNLPFKKLSIHVTHASVQIHMYYTYIQKAPEGAGANVFKH